MIRQGFVPVGKVDTWRCKSVEKLTPLLFHPSWDRFASQTSNRFLHVDGRRYSDCFAIVLPEFVNRLCSNYAVAIFSLLLAYLPTDSSLFPSIILHQVMGSNAFSPTGNSGLYLNHQDIAPRYSVEPPMSGGK
ncbi:hypothetical protein L1987_04441 [Smallanthus sonchifolius]|uniref:Uncharacterized protein n=1 Tax=Smallanthus sonchifolius TaxID=185202 RepID=A0ACB9KDK2_9ASTR|nr:hypothetical protein L1987_04441 [Smallanthus sonchifolius]